MKLRWEKDSDALWVLERSDTEQTVGVLLLEREDKGGGWIVASGDYDNLYNEDACHPLGAIKTVAAAKRLAEEWLEADATELCAALATLRTKRTKKK